MTIKSFVIGVGEVTPSSQDLTMTAFNWSLFSKITCFSTKYLLGSPYRFGFFLASKTS
jgi:predicted membrane-bound dolichyl-phosphate-mannose-protein mannosyltransferase